MDLEAARVLIPCSSPGSRVWDAFFEELNMIQEFVVELKGWFVNFGRILSGALIVIGLILWASDIFGYKGKKLMTAGVILFFVLEAIASL